MAYYELWGGPGKISWNMIDTTEDGAYMARLVRDLLANGWTADELSLGITEDGPALDTAELLAWLDAQPV